MKMDFSKDELAMVYQYAAGTKEGTLAGLKEIVSVAMYEKDGQPLEVVAKHFYEAKFKRPKTRPYKTKNYYALLVQQADVEMEVNRIVQNSRKADSEE